MYKELAGSECDKLIVAVGIVSLVPEIECNHSKTDEITYIFTYIFTIIIIQFIFYRIICGSL